MMNDEVQLQSGMDMEMSPAHRVVIVGAGVGGAELAMALRRDGHEGEIVLVGNEGHPPYDRPPLSKKALIEGSAADRLYLRAASAYAQASVDLRLGAPVVALDPEAREVRMVDGGTIRFDRCVLATGAAPRIPPIPGIGLPGVFVLRDLDDMTALRAAAGNARNAVILGGGYLGLELAASLRRLGLAVMVVEAAGSLLARSASTLCASALLARHEMAGTRVLTGARVSAVRGATAVEGLELSDGRFVSADLVVCAIGARPRIELAEAAGIACDNGILTGETCETGLPGIYAIGDCANWLSPTLGRRRRLESIQAATFQARIVSAAICGKPVPAERIPYFWSEQFDDKLQIAGVVDPAAPCRDEVVGDLDGDFAVYRFQRDTLAAVEALNRPRDFVLAQRLIGKPGISMAPSCERDTA